MVAYLLTRPHFIHRPGSDSPVLVEAGQTIEWGDNVPSLGMAGVDEEGEAKCKERDAKLKERRDDAVGRGASRALTDSLPKAEPAPPLPDEEGEESHRGRRTRR